MDRSSKLKYQQDVEKYLEEQKVYHIFEDMLKSLIINKPDDPIQYLIKTLSEPQPKKIFIVGPPGAKVKELALHLSEHFNFNSVSVGDLIRKELSKKSELSQQIEQSIDKFEYVKDDIVIQIVQNYLQQLDNEKQNYILEGFPKTRVQGLAFQKQGIIPDSFIILEMSPEKIAECSLSKINNQDGYYSNLPVEQKQKMAENHVIEYQLNLKQVKEIYENFYFQVDGDNLNNNKLEEILQDMATLLKYKISNNAPKRAARILILGPPGSGRSTLSKQLCKRYGLLYISTRELIANLIKQKGESGQLALQQMNSGDLVPDEMINALVKERINCTDCQIQGFVLDGFPKTEDQLRTLPNQPSLIVLLDAQEKQINDRLSKRRIDPLTGQIYENVDQVKENIIKQRLIVPANEKPQVIKQRFERWKELMKLIESNRDLSCVTFKVQGSLNAQNAFERVANHLEKII